jgi:hypothetical protein
MKGSTVVILIILVIFGIACLQPVLADEQGADNSTTSDDVAAGSGETTYSAEALIVATAATTAPTPTPYVTTGSFQISSNPSGASVWVDGIVQAGMTPITVTGLTQGNHLVEVEKTGYQRWETQAYAQVGATTNIFANLVPGTSPTTVPTTTVTVTATTTGPTTVPTPATGNLQVTSNPPEAKIYIDGSYRGITPAIISDLSTGYHLVALNKTGYQTWMEQVYIWGGQTNNVLATLVPGNDSGVTPTTTATTTPSPTATTTTSPTNGYASSATFGIYSTPANATVYIDSVYQGKTPIVVTGLTQGFHTVKIQKTGYKTWETTAYGQIGATTTIFTALVPGADATPTGNTTATATTATTIPTPSTPPHYGTLSVISFPTGAAVWIDGASKGLTPVNLAGTLVGNHTVKIEKTGYKTWQTVATVTEGNTTQVNAVLAPISLPNATPTATKTVAPTFPTPTKTLTPTPTPVPSGSLMVMSNPSGGSIYLDNVFKGDAPQIISSIPVGNHTVRVAVTGYENWTGTVNIQQGTLTRVIANLVPGFL